MQALSDSGDEKLWCTKGRVDDTRGNADASSKILI